MNKEKIQAALTELEAVEEMEWSGVVRKLKESFARDDGVSVLGLIRMANFATQLLHDLATTRPEIVKPHARHQITWPSEISIAGGDEKKYEALLGEFNQWGQRTNYGPIEIGKGLPYKLSRKIKGGLMRRVAVRACGNLLSPERRAKSSDWLEVCFGTFEPYAQWKGKNAGAAVDWLATLPRFTEDNWPQWEPIVGRYLDFSWGPRELRESIVPTHRHTEPLFLEQLKAPELHASSDPEIVKITRNQKNSGPKWRSALKPNLIQKCAELCW